jgi:streptomycin 6-kinase
MSRASPSPASLVPLEPWFRALWPAAEIHGGVLLKSAAAARGLLAQPREVGVLHGDLHHGNVLDFGPRGWLAIDPKGLIGDRGYDHANMLCNPDADTATAPGVMARRVGVVSEAARIAPVRLLSWFLAYLGLSAAWSLGDGPGDARRTLEIAQMAAQQLEACSGLR